MPKRAHDGAESTAKVARRTGVLESLPTELIELFAVYSGAQACAALAQTCRWLAAFLHEPARRRRLEDAHTTRSSMNCLVPRKSAAWHRATSTWHVLPSGIRHGVEEVRSRANGELMQQWQWNNGWWHGKSKYWRKDGSLRWICEWNRGEPIRVETFNKDGTRHSQQVTFDKYGTAVMPSRIVDTIRYCD